MDRGSHRRSAHADMGKACTAVPADRAPVGTATFTAAAFMAAIKVAASLESRRQGLQHTKSLDAVLGRCCFVLLRLDDVFHVEYGPGVVPLQAALM
ncbi:hypothetical protein NDU88_010672 [Pleurodeles waltl]|uniref:Uncharacterized protein n=1 Tax=Pleurodeles waltl TaxID=8319 RepID=A0AAV7Q2N2_PLEWA|nr:hypothetical protein NDU88_010672 [Pleurodeles waltl]